jgi:hypothetical protein
MNVDAFIAQLRRDEAGRNGPSIYASDRVFGLLARLAEVERELERSLNALDCTRHAAAVATIGHEQLNRMIAVVDGAGFKGAHVEEGVRRMAQELAALRARVANTEDEL